jgi:hypothetical protein
MEQRATAEICVFLASVVKDGKRKQRLREMLQSAREQTTKPDYFCVSIYIENTTNEELEDMFKDVADHIRIARRKQALPQFCQYRDLAKQFHTTWYPGKNPWIVFTDDDDMWHPLRIAKFHYGISHCTGLYDNVSGIGCAESTRQLNSQCCPVQSWEDVDWSLGCGCALADPIPNDSLTEYHYCTLVLSEFQCFLDAFSFHVKHNRFTDMLMSNYVHNSGGVDRHHGVLPTRPGEWTYFYRDGRAEYPTVTSYAVDPANERDHDGIILEQLENPRIIKQALKGLRAGALAATPAEIADTQMRLQAKRRLREQLAAAEGHVLMPVPELEDLLNIPEEPDVDARYTEYLSRYLWKK